MLCNLDDGEFTSGAHLRVYETSAGRIGLVIGEDLFFPEVVKTLSDCDADIAICLYEENVDFLPQVLMRAFAFCYGLDICLVRRRDRAGRLDGRGTFPLLSRARMRRGDRLQARISSYRAQKAQDCAARSRTVSEKTTRAV